MANRNTHNKVAVSVVKGLTLKVADEVNKQVDDKEMLNKYGRYHRQHWGHNPDPTAPDSILINKGDAKREKARKVHIIVDTDPKIKNAVARMELREKIKKMK